MQTWSGSVRPEPITSDDGEFSRWQSARQRGSATANPDTATGDNAEFRAWQAKRTPSTTHGDPTGDVNLGVPAPLVARVSIPVPRMAPPDASVVARRGRWTYVFARGEGRRLEVSALELQLQATTYRMPTAVARDGR